MVESRSLPGCRAVTGSIRSDSPVCQSDSSERNLGRGRAARLPKFPRLSGSTAVTHEPSGRT
eukprot:215799-Hanusia_phi.AAC.2